MIGTDPRQPQSGDTTTHVVYKCTLYAVHGNGRRFGRYCTREDAEKAINRLAPAYNILPENFTVTEELS